MLELSSTPVQPFFETHYFCDYVELLALAANTDDISSSDVIDRFYDDRSEGFDQGGADHSKMSDRWEGRVMDWFIILESRESTFKEHYPFSITSRNLISLKENLTHKQRLYLFFLLSSNLGFLPTEKRSDLTTDFETISTKALKAYLPSFSKSHTFGKSASTNSRYIGSIEDKIRKFAKDIDQEADFEDDFFADNDSGDYGLDVVAWTPLPNDPNLNRIQIFLGQCATGKNWLDKQHEPKKVINAIRNLHHSIIMLFIPYDCRNSDRSFNNKARLITQLLFDRARLISLLQGETDHLPQLASNQIVLDAIDYEEALV